MKEKEPDPKGSGISPSGKSGEPLKPNPQKSGSFPSIKKQTDSGKNPSTLTGEGSSSAEGPYRPAPSFHAEAERSAFHIGPADAATKPVSLKEIEQARSVLAFLSWPMPQRLALALERAVALLEVVDEDRHIELGEALESKTCGACKFIKEFYDRP
jgi:hypothetical protein